MPTLEKEIEAKLVRLVTQTGGLCLKFTCPGNSGVPDRIILKPVAEEHRAIVAKYVQFVEVKQQGKTPTKLQHWWIDRLKGLGFCAWWTDRVA